LKLLSEYIRLREEEFDLVLLLSAFGHPVLLFFGERTMQLGSFTKGSRLSLHRFSMHASSNISISNQKPV
jgi:hypothetical protein